MNISVDFFDFSKINFTFVTIIGGVFLILLGALYYVIFHKHHKRNNVELFELVELVTKFYVRSIVLLILLAISVYFIIMGVHLQEERTDAISCVVIAIIIASLSILSYRKYIKLSLLDYNTEVRAENNERKLKIGEVLEVICFIICILAPIWRIPGFIEVFDNKSKLAVEIIKSFGISIGGLILMFSLNPMNVKRFFVEEEKLEEPIKKKRGRPKKNSKDNTEKQFQKLEKDNATKKTKNLDINDTVKTAETSENKTVKKSKNKNSNKKQNSTTKKFKSSKSKATKPEKDK